MILFALAVLLHAIEREPWPFARVAWTLMAGGLFFLAWSQWPTLAPK